MLRTLSGGRRQKVNAVMVFLFDGRVHFPGPVAELKRQTREQSRERAIAQMMALRLAV